MIPHLKANDHKLTTNSNVMPYLVLLIRLPWMEKPVTHLNTPSLTTYGQQSQKWCWNELWLLSLPIAMAQREWHTLVQQGWQLSLALPNLMCGTQLQKLSNEVISIGNTLGSSLSRSWAEESVGGRQCYTSSHRVEVESRSIITDPAFYHISQKGVERRVVVHS